MAAWFALEFLDTVDTLSALRPRRGDILLRRPARFAPSLFPVEAIRASIDLSPKIGNIGGLASLSVRENLLLAHLGAHRALGLGYGRREKKMDELMDSSRFAADRLLRPILLKLSGGFRRKLIVARWLLLEPR